MPCVEVRTEVTAARELEDLNHLVELLISPMWRQLADAALKSGLTDAFGSGQL